MNRNMYIVLIVAGVVLVIIGIIGLTRQTHQNNTIIVEHRDAIASEGQNTQRSGMAAHQSYSQQATTDAKQTNKEKGNDFEGYVADCFADKSVFKVLAWNQGVSSPNGVHAENNTDPDFHVKQKFSDKFDCEYYVEAKYHSRWSENNMLTLNDYQLRRYRDFQQDKHRKVLVAIGIGSTAKSPAEFYVIPLDSISGPNLPATTLSQFRLTNPHKTFRNYVHHYFESEVFPAARNKKTSNQ